MENILEKSFVNNQLGIKLNSYIDEQCNVWFQAKQVAQILGYKNTVDVIKRHVSESNKIKKVHPRETRGCTFTFYINEAGFYELVFRSRLPAAKMFRQWVFSKVLPSIRKYGYFKMFKSKLKQRVIIEGVKYYRHSVFSKYAASKNGEVINVKTGRIIKMIKCNGYLYLNICDKNLKNQRITTNIVLFLKFSEGQFHDVLKLITSIMLSVIIESKICNYFHINKM